MHSFIQPSELGHCTEDENDHVSKRLQSGFEPGMSTMKNMLTISGIRWLSSIGLTNGRVMQNLFPRFNVTLFESRVY